SLARALRTLSGSALLSRLDEERRATDAQDIIVYDSDNRAEAISSAQPTAQPPGPPAPELVLQIANGRPYVSLNPLADGRYTITTAAPIGENPDGGQGVASQTAPDPGGGAGADA